MTSTHFIKIITCIYLWLLSPTTLNAIATATATVTYTVPTIATIAFSGNPGTLTINNGIPGSGLVNATDNTTTWAISTNLTNQRITASINSNLPAGLVLEVSLAAPSGASSVGSVALSTTAANLVTGITQIASSNMSVIYTLKATVLAPTGTLNRTITYTLSS
jgi:hypothetical protein